MRKVALAVSLCLLPASLWAQDGPPRPAGVMLPGSINVGVGTIAPAEKDNVLGSVAVEQGVAFWRHRNVFAVAFANVGVRHDSQGLPWNRRVPMMGGAKLVVTPRVGVLQAGLGVATEMYQDDLADLMPSGFVNYWAGWRGDRLADHSRPFLDAFPGSLYASTGVVTPAEPGNWTSSVSAQQGVSVVRIGGVAVVPFVGGMANVDSDRLVWNNRTQVDAGVKLARNMFGGAVEAGVAQRRDHLRLTGETRTAPAVFVNMWFGWTPRAGRP